MNTRLTPIFPRTQQRQNRALPPALRRRKPPSLQRDHPRPVLPRPTPPTPRQGRETPGPLHPQEPPPLSGLILSARRPRSRQLPPRLGRPRHPAEDGRDAHPLLQRQDLLRPPIRTREAKIS